MANVFPEEVIAPTRALLEASIAVSAALERRAVGPIGVEPAQADLMVRLSLAASGGLRGVEIGEQLKINPARVSRLVDRAEDAGIVVRAPDPLDRRAQQVTLTRRGRDLAASYSPLMVEVITEAVFEELEESEVDLLVSLLNRVRDSATKVLEAAAHG